MALDAGTTIAGDHQALGEVQLYQIASRSSSSSVSSTVLPQLDSNSPNPDGEDSCYRLMFEPSALVAVGDIEAASIHQMGGGPLHNWVKRYAHCYNEGAELALLQCTCVGVCQGYFVHFPSSTARVSRIYLSQYFMNGL